MEESDFWTRLEHRICDEFAGFENSNIRFYWCDGLVPEEYDLHSEEPCIRGRAWCGQSGQEHWQFTLVVGRTIGSQGEIDWSALIPDRSLTGWLTPDPEKKALTIDPLSGYSEGVGSPSDAGHALI